MKRLELWYETARIGAMGRVVYGGLRECSQARADEFGLNHKGHRGDGDHRCVKHRSTARKRGRGGGGGVRILVCKQRCDRGELGVGGELVRAGDLARTRVLVCKRCSAGASPAAAWAG